MKSFTKKLAQGVRSGIKKGAIFLGKSLPYVSNFARTASSFLSNMPGIPGIVGKFVHGAIKKGDDLIEKLPEPIKEKAKKYVGDAFAIHKEMERARPIEKSAVMPPQPINIPKAEVAPKVHSYILEKP